MNQKKWFFTHGDIARATGLTLNATHQHFTRGYYDPERLETVVLYLAHFAADHLRQKIVNAAIIREQEDAIGLPKLAVANKERRAKIKAKREADKG
jgi:hypothetical protein